MDYKTAKSQKSQNTVLIALIGLLVLLLVILGVSNLKSAADGNRNSELPSAAGSVATESPEVIEVDPNALSVADCTQVHVDITLVENTLSKGTFTPSQAAQLLRRAAGDWTQLSTNATGSEAAWLDKMSELASAVSSYILTGTPSNGVQKLNQLTNNMNLYSQFCPSPSF